MFSTSTMLALMLAAVFACDSQPRIAALYVSTTALGAGDGSECAPFASIDSAIATAQDAGGGTIQVLGTPSDRFTLCGRAISAMVDIRGRGCSLELTGRLTIQVKGYLKITGLTITPENSASEGFNVAGHLAITNSTIMGFSQAIMVTGGAVAIQNTEILKCGESITVSGSHAFLNISRVAFRHNLESLVLTIDERTKSVMEILVAGCVFEANSGQSLLSARVINRLSAVSINVDGCQFLNNSARALDISGFNLKVTLSRCTFISNRNGTVRIGPTRADITLVECEWVKHRGKAIEVLRLIGKLALVNTTFSEHLSDTPLFIANAGNSTSCLFQLSNSTYRHSDWTTTNRNAGFLLMTNCIASVTGLTVENITVAGPFGLYNGLIDIQKGFVEMHRLSIKHSQSNQALLYVVFSSVFIIDSEFHEVASGLNVLSILSLNANISFVNFYIKGAAGIATSESLFLSEGKLLYFVSNLNNLFLRDVDIDARTGGAVVGQFFGTFAAESLTIRNGQFNVSLIATVEVNMNISNFHVKNCSSEAIITSKGRVTFSASNVSIDSSAVGRVFACTIFAQCTFSNITVLNSTCHTLLQAQVSTIHLNNIHLFSSNMTYVLKGSVGSSMNLANLTVENCNGALAEMYGSQAVIANSEICNSRSTKPLLISIQANITLIGVAIIDGKSEVRSLADIRDQSDFQIIGSEIRDLRWSDGITLKESAVTVAESRFSGFSSTLLVGNYATVSLTRSYFHSGGHGNCNRLLHGGVLSCGNCERVTVVAIHVVATGSGQGGGMHFSNSAVTVTRSTFQNCSAINGGALAFIDTHFHISESNFTLCSASGSGGAIDMWNSAAISSEISNCVFALNAAKVGGALNIREAEPLLRAISFQWNTAGYGPDTASYTVAARVGSGFPTNVSYVSGNPFPQSLKIELLDHFNQVVQTDNIAQLSFNLPPGVQYGGMAQAVAQNGVIDLGTAPFYAPPNSSNTISTSIMLHCSSTHRTFNFSWELFFRACQLGEVEHSDRCEICPAGMFSLSRNNAQCQLCPANAFCPGGFEIDLNKGFWRTSVNSSELLACPSPEKCLGGTNSQCEEGYTGKLCSECSDTWYRVGTLYCQRCVSIFPVFQIILFILQYLTVLFAAYYLSEVKPNDTRSAALQIWVDYCQCTLVPLRQRVEQPQVLQYLYQSLSYFGSLSAAALPASCLFPAAHSPYLKMHIVATLPVPVLLAVLALVHVCVAKLTRGKVARLVGILLYFAGAAVTESFTALQLSFKLGRSSPRWLYEDASIESWSSDHIYRMKYIYSPLFAFYILLPLLIITVAVVTCRMRQFTTAYCPLVASGLKEKFFFAQVIIHYWKLLFIILTMVLTARTQLYQTTISLSLLVAVIPAIVAAGIYSKKSLLFLSLGSKVVVFCSVSVAEYYAEHPASGSNYQYFFSLSLLGQHLLLWWFFAKIVMQGKSEEMRECPVPSQLGVHISLSCSEGILDAPHNSMQELKVEDENSAPRIPAFQE